jgi:hypothetical protein
MIGTRMWPEEYSGDAGTSDTASLRSLPRADALMSAIATGVGRTDMGEVGSLGGVSRAVRPVSWRVWDPRGPLADAAPFWRVTSTVDRLFRLGSRFQATNALVREPAVGV